MAKSYYFEFRYHLASADNLMTLALQKFEHLDLCYYKYTRYVLGNRMKYIGIIQFAKRVNRSVVLTTFNSSDIAPSRCEHVAMPQERMHMRVLILAKHHGVEDNIHEEGEFGFGGRASNDPQRALHHRLVPYQLFLREYLKDGVCKSEHALIPALPQLLCFADALAHLTEDLI